MAVASMGAMWDEIKSDMMKLGVLIALLIIVFIILSGIRACQAIF